MHHQAALAIADQIASLDQQGRAHEGLGNLSAAVGDPVGARRHWQQALAIYLQMETPDIGRIRAKLAATETHKPRPDCSTDRARPREPMTATSIMDSHPAGPAPEVISAEATTTRATS